MFFADSFLLINIVKETPAIKANRINKALKPLFTL